MNNDRKDNAEKRSYEAPALVEHDLLLEVTAQTSSTTPTTTRFTH